MKNMIKKITAFAMAFTILGTGTAVTKTVSPSSFTTMTAEAAATYNSQNEKTVYEYLTNDLGLTTAAACGALANMELESKFDPNAINGGSGAYGICQWLGQRKTYLQKYTNYTNIKVQLDYMKSELTQKPRKGISDYRKVGDLLKQNKADTASAAYQAGYDWCYYYEVPSTDKQKLASISAKRGELAKTYFKQYSTVTKRFTDVKEGIWYVNAIQFVFDSKFMVGKSASHFAPSATLTRAEFATVLNNMSGKMTVSYSSNEKPSDVKDNQWYTQPVMWAYKKGITNGIGTISKSKFGVSVQITREEIVTMLYNYAKFRGKNVSSSSSALQNYSDKNQISTWAKPAMQWAVGKGVMSGKSSKILDPRGTATRAECAQFILNYANKIGL